MTAFTTNPSSTDSASRRPLSATIIAVCFALFALNATAQVVLRLIGESSDPVLLMSWQSLVAASGWAAAVLAWRQHRAAVLFAVLYGVITGTMIVALGRILELGADAQNGLWASGAVVLVLSLALAWALRRSQIRKY